MEIGEPVAPPATPPAAPTDQPRIVAVLILHGDDEDAATGGAIQWVDLTKDDKWVDGSKVFNKVRCGQKLRVKVKFDRPGAHSFDLKLIPDPANCVYSGAEQGRNANFKYQDAKKSYTTDGDGTKIVDGDLFVHSAGNCAWWVTATDQQGNEVRSGTLRTGRIMHYVELKMQGVKAAASLAQCEAEYLRQGVQLVRLDPVDMDRMPNISNAQSDLDTFKAKARSAYAKSQAPSKEPYVIAVAYTDHLAVKDSSQSLVVNDVTVGPGATPVTVPVALPDGTAKYLWHDIVPGEDWFVSATFAPASGGPSSAIAAAQCTASGSGNYWNQVTVDVSRLSAGKGTLTLVVNWVNRMRGGVSLGGGNIVVICTRAWWKDKDGSGQNQVAVHELGHQIRMVVDGTGKGPDKVATQYDGKGHVGSHCHHGLPVQASYATAKGDCVMFGATNPHVAFCENCSVAVRKQDLSDGWKAF